MMNSLFFLLGILSVFTVLPAHAQFTGEDYAIFGGYDQSSGPNGSYFKPGDTVKLRGNFYATSNSSPQTLNDVLVDVTMYEPNGETVPILQNYVPKKSGEFEAEIHIDDKFPIGKYDFSFTAHKEGETSEPNEHQSPFYVARIKEFIIPAEGKEFRVETESIEFEISNLTFDKESKSLTIDAKRIPGKYAADDYLQFENQVGMIIQRPLISPPFFLVVNGQESYFDEYSTKITDDQYSFSINLNQIQDKGTATLAGTYVVPEFGAIASLILIASMLVFLIISGTKWNPV